MEEPKAGVPHRPSRTNFLAPSKPRRRNLIYSAISANLLYMSVGCATAWPSAALPLLQGLSKEQEAVTVSLLLFGSCFGPTIYGISMDRLGRKFSLLLCGVLYLFSWLVLGLGDSSPVLYLGRVLAGLAVGFTFNSVPVYISEISNADCRQTLTSLTEVFISLGCLLPYALGPYLTYIDLVVACSLPSLVFCLAMMKAPETPYHLVRFGRTPEALQVLVFLRGTSQDVTAELAAIEASVRDSFVERAPTSDLFLRRGPRKALLSSTLLFLVLPFCAVDIFLPYLVPVLEDTTLPLSPRLATILLSLLQVIFGSLEPLVVHRLGSKWTLVASSYFCALFLVSFGIYKWFDERHYSLENVSTVPLICLVLYQVFFVLGVGSLTWSISVELFPAEHKSLGIWLVTTLNWVADAIVVTLYGILYPTVGESACFLTLGAVLIVGTSMVASLVPNTKGQTLDSIQERLGT